ncbi:50S ribosomal protein L9 [Labilibaculum filiforme]|uniref:Large ribosomal subunit protein bL9 n=1 Tax=Labilibaculum filiforme TaxID=1940526 RepID=A0A2N3HQL0_9BACT|nr:50S ribosomal protein L9 [Labilibaculum filiforme]PKQ60341.1 50S ribosomal protein L9 [Labilibaculum filiforme]
MEVILKQDIHSLGYMNDIVVVKNGYGRNYLIPKGIAILATESAKKMNAENMRQRAHKEEKIKNEALEVAKKLEGVTLSVGAKTSTTGKIFGSVNNIQIAEALIAQGFEIDRKVIVIKDAVKEIGKYTATIKLHKEVKVDIEFDVISE